MSVLWRDGDVPAKYIAKLLTEELGWNVNTTYTLIKRCIKKGAIERSDPGFMCHALVPKEEVQEAETNNLLPQKAFHVLWEISAVRLMIPFSIPSAISVYSLMDSHLVEKNWH